VKTWRWVYVNVWPWYGWFLVYVPGLLCGFAAEFFWRRWPGRETYSLHRGLVLLGLGYVAAVFLLRCTLVLLSPLLTDPEGMMRRPRSNRRGFPIVLNRTNGT